MNTSINLSTFLHLSGKQDKKARTNSSHTIESDDTPTLNTEENCISQTSYFNNLKTIWILNKPVKGNGVNMFITNAVR